MRCYIARYWTRAIDEHASESLVRVPFVFSTYGAIII